MKLMATQLQTITSSPAYSADSLADDSSLADIDISAHFRMLPATIERLLTQGTASNRWLIIQRRYGFGGVECETLESLGELLRCTRERVRQIEAEGREILASQLFADTRRPAALVTAGELMTAHAIWAIVERLAAERELFTFSEAQRAVAQCCQVSAEETLPITRLVLALQDIHTNDTRLPALGRVCTRGDTATRKRHMQRLSALYEAICEVIAGVDEFALIKSANKSLPPNSRMTLRDGQRLLPLLEGAVERLPDGRLRAQFSALRGRGNQVERLFIDENAQTFTLPALAMKINERLTPLGHAPVNPRNLGNQISRDGRFAPIGKSGEWTLASEAVETGSIVDLMRHCLHERGKPATTDDIYDYVGARRKVGRNSISIYLTQGTPACFRRCGRDLWALAIWPKDLFTSRDKETIAKIVAAYFSQRHAKKLPWGEVRDALASELAASREDARYLLQHNPVVKTEKTPNGQRLAVLQPDYKERLWTPPTRQSRADTVMNRMKERTVALLDAAPTHELPLAELKLALMQEFPQQSSATVYGYISKCDNVEKYQSPGMPMMARLKASAKPAPER